MSTPAYTLVKRYNFNSSSILTDTTQLDVANKNRCASAAGLFQPPVASTFTPGHGSAVQAPRLKENVTIEPDGTASDGFLIRLWNREAVNGVYSSYPAPWSNVNRPATAGAWHAKAPGTIQTYGGYRYRARRTVSGTGGWKGVTLLWPNSGGWSNTGANELDVEEWYNYFASGTDKGANTNLHYNTGTATNINEQQYQTYNKTPPPWAGIDTTVWHVIEIQWARGFFDIYVGDGNGANMVRVVHRTDANSIPTIPMWIGTQNAMLEAYYQAHGVRGTDYYDMDWLEIYSSSGIGTCPNTNVLTGSNNGGGGGTGNQPPTVPQSVVAVATSNTSVHLLWSPSTDNTGAALAGYHVKRGTSALGPFTTVATVVNASYVDTGLLANTTYYYQVTAFDAATPPAESDTDTTTPCLTLNTSTPPPTAVLAVTPVTGASPLTATAVLSGSTGSPSFTLDWGDGSAVDTWANIAAVPTPYTHVYTGSSACLVTLTATNGNGSDTDQLTVTPSIPTSTQTANLGLSYGVQGQAVSANKYKTNLDLIDTFVSSNAQGANGSYIDESQTILSSTVRGESYPRFVLLAGGVAYQGDGTFDPTTGTAVFGATAPTIPAGTESFAWVTSGNTAAATSNNYTLTLPTIADTGYAVAGLMIKDTLAATITTPAGWSLLGSQNNSNGACKLWLYGRTYTSALAGTTVVFASTQSQATCAMIMGYTNATGVDVAATLTSGNSTTSQTTAVAPTQTPVASGEMYVCIYAARGVSNGASAGQGLAANASTTQRAREGTTLASGNQVALMSADVVITGTTATGTTAAACAPSYTVGASLLLTHA